MEKDFDAKLKIQGDSSNGGDVLKTNSFAFRAPQKNFTIQDFDLGKIYGVGSYSKVVRAKKKDYGVVYALKIMDKKFITKENKTAYVRSWKELFLISWTIQTWHLNLVKAGELFDQITRKL